MKRTGIVPANSSFSLTITAEDADNRIDKYLSEQFPLYSRSYFQKLINDHYILINNNPIQKSGAKLKINDIVTITFPPEQTISPTDVMHANIPIKIIQQHEHFLIIEKPANLLVHKATSKNDAITVVDWILAHYKDIATVGYADRPGIVHRLDKDTSGLLIIPRTNYAHSVFTDLFKNRTIQKTYYAVVEGHPPKEGFVDLAIGRHPIKRTSMTTFAHPDPDKGIRAAKSYYKVVEYYQHHSLVEIKPVTGRTHQIRVHLAAIGHPIVGDIVYGKSSPYINRQALHAAALSFNFDGAQQTCIIDLPDDIKKLIKQIKKLPDKK